ncbi:hypothetical protein DFJ58DRAFT_845468 [Suillus subalutaceus]|uniref:uncharacterized protein n=1 Tax=Suillus subalutaceus TaxID=48586 RepID=UPI001B85D77F|nr:uncharacterized protein DFJ58DRAFT_845468 [Suillus subalutaceus]KAG1840061.1 hypothetical protein DFJ58DRAFT_845468 [Suillus subalutaceus]
MRIGTKVMPCNLCVLDWQANGHQHEPPSESHSAMIPPSNENTPVSVPEVQSNTDAVSLAVKHQEAPAKHQANAETCVEALDSVPPPWTEFPTHEKLLARSSYNGSQNNNWPQHI